MHARSIQMSKSKRSGTHIRSYFSWFWQGEATHIYACMCTANTVANDRHNLVNYIFLLHVGLLEGVFHKPTLCIMSDYLWIHITVLNNGWKNIRYDLFLPVIIFWVLWVCLSLGLKERDSVTCSTASYKVSAIIYFNTWRVEDRIRFKTQEL